MTDSTTQGGKRERLVAAACQTVYEQGIEKTTLADIAAAAGIPVGNVYYYFKTKNDIIQAVVESHLREADTLLAAIEDGYDSPRDRLKTLFATLAGQVDLIARYGCPHGSLCAELDKHGDGPGMGAELMRAPIEWIGRQFEAMGRPDASDLAVHLLARYQGAALLTSAFRDPRLMAREAAHAAEWIDALDLSRTEAAYSIRSQFFQLSRSGHSGLLQSVRRCHALMGDAYVSGTTEVRPDDTGRRGGRELPGDRRLWRQQFRERRRCP